MAIAAWLTAWNFPRAAVARLKPTGAHVVEEVYGEWHDASGPQDGGSGNEAPGEDEAYDDKDDNGATIVVAGFRDLATVSRATKECCCHPGIAEERA